MSTALDKVMDALKQAGTGDSLQLLGSTSKITFAGSGASSVAMSSANQTTSKQQLGIAQVGPDKINQLRHVKFLRDSNGVHAHMLRHAALLKPRFDSLIKQLRGPGGWDIARWIEPSGGYLVSFDTRPGLAKIVVAMTASANVVLMCAVATFPYGNDPEDSNIRSAPSFPSLADIEQAMKALVCSVKLATVQPRLAPEQGVGVRV